MKKRELKQERATRTRGEILGAAIHLFATGGYVATTMSELAKAIKMTPGALYWHFPTKEDLLISALEELSGRLVREYTDLLTEGRKFTAHAQLLALFERSAAIFEKNREYGIFLSGITTDASVSSPPVAEAAREVLANSAAIFVNVVRYGQKTGEFRKDIDSMQVGHALFACHTGLIAHHRLFLEKAAFEPMAWALHAMVLKGIAVDVPQEVTRRGRASSSEH